MKANRKYKKFYEECWQLHIHLLRTNSHRDAARTLNLALDLELNEKDTDYEGRCAYNASHGVGIALVNWKPNAKGISILAHEVFHAVEYIMDARDTKLKPATSETWAYLLDSLLFRCLTLLK